MRLRESATADGAVSPANTRPLPLVSEGGAREWPRGAVDVDELRQRGWRPTPIRQFLFKVHSRCNLACDYCYVYEHADQSWRAKPAMMSAEVLSAAATRIAEHAEAHDLDEVRVILHGGEPLLCGAGFLEDTATTLRATLPNVELRLGMQTNGVLLTERLARLCARLGIRIGVSIDGDREANDRHRLDARGRSSYDGPAQAIRLLQGNDELRPLLSGLLCTIDLDSDPLAVYEHLLAFAPPSIDFLLPHGNWATPPPGKADPMAAAPYAEWLIPIFDRWFDEQRHGTGIRFFEEIINLLLGGRSRVESIGLTPVSLVVIETDGTLEQVDSLKSAFDGAPVTGLDVFRNTFDDALRVPEVAARQIGFDALCATCRNCELAAVCGAGLYPHRYRPQAGFRNPSVYCRDLFELIEHVRRRLDEALREEGLA